MILIRIAFFETLHGIFFQISAVLYETEFQLNFISENSLPLDGWLKTISMTVVREV